MLVAVDGTGVRHTASANLGPTVACPDCGDELVVRLPASRVPHFAHRPHRKCDAAKARARRAAERRRSHLAAQRAAADIDDTQPSLFDLLAPDE